MDKNVSNSAGSQRGIIYTGSGLAIGAALGIMFGLMLFENLATGAVIGAGLGLIIGAIVDARDGRQIHVSNVPLGVMLIAAFYTFGAIVLLVSSFTNPVGVSREIALAHGLPPTMGVEILLAVAALALAIAYGLFSLSRWGFFLTIAYLLYFGAANLLVTDSVWTVHEGNALWAVLVVIYLLVVRRHFLSTQ